MLPILDQDALLTLQSEARRLGGFAAFAGLRGSLLLTPKPGAVAVDAVDFTLAVATAFALASAENALESPMLEP